MRRGLLSIGIALAAAGAAGLACAQQGAVVSGRAGGAQAAGQMQGGHGEGHGSVVHGVSGPLGRGGVVVGSHAGGGGRGGHVARYGRGYRSYGVGYGYLPYDYAQGDSGGGYGPDGQPEVAAPPVRRGPEIVDRLTPAPEAATQATATIKEYKWAGTGTETGAGAASATPAAAAHAATPSTGSAGSEEQVFALVLKDGSTLTAETVYAADGNLHYVDPDGRHLRIPVAAVDRTATLAANRARGMRLYLPAG